MRENLRKSAPVFVVAALLVLDRATKLWALSVLKPRVEISLLPFLSLTYVENTGVAFGLFRGSNAPMIFLSAALAAGLLWWRSRIPGTERLERAAVLLVITGALGNLYDRIAYGFVVDFVDFRVWPVFNAADSCITVGACLLALCMFMKKEPAAGP